jgi:hypothetical protein
MWCERTSGEVTVELAIECESIGRRRRGWKREARWTDHVADNDELSTDPVDEPGGLPSESWRPPRVLAPR